MATPILVKPPQRLAPNPALATPAPASPPISAWELLEGSPTCQVSTFQVVAPISAPKITRVSTRPGSITPVPTVFATLRPKTRKAMKLKKAAQHTANCGLSTRVDTMVAMELAASCRPLTRSNSRATKMSPISSGGTGREKSIGSL